MLGLGEDIAEVRDALRELRLVGVEIITLGQYLQPTRKHAPVARYLEPAEFDELRDFGASLGFLHIESGPLVRSSYHAESQARTVTGDPAGDVGR